MSSPIEIEELEQHLPCPGGAQPDDDAARKSSESQPGKENILLEIGSYYCR